MTSETDALAPRALLIDERTGGATPRFAVARLVRPTGLAAALLIALVLTISAVPRQGAEGTLPSAAAARLEALPPAALSLVSRTLGRDQAPYRIHRVATGLAATNNAHGLELGFDAGGLHVRSGSDTLSLHLRAAGYGEELKAVAAAVPSEQDNQVLYRRGPLREWYANGPLGLEQGFTMRAPPAGARSGPLTLALSLSGSLRPALDRGAKSLAFAHSSLRYAGLGAFDARGHQLPATLGLRGHTLLIRVDDRGARYPLRIDPFVQKSQLAASDGVAGDYLGVSVAIDGDTIVVGAWGADVGGVANAGAVYVFVKPAGGWANATQTAKLTASNDLVHPDMQLGYSAAISGDTIVAGAPAYAYPRALGFVYVYVKPAGGWTNATQTAILGAFNDGSDDSEIAGEHLGTSVAIDGDTIVAGAPDWPFDGTNQHRGALYVWAKPAGGWVGATQTARLTKSDGRILNYFGNYVAISGDTIVGGSIQYTDSADLFVKPAGGWVDGTETAKLMPAGYVPGPAHAPGPMAIDGDTAVVAAGSAYVFVEPAGGWASGNETAKLTASDGASFFTDSAPSVAISGDTIVGGGQFAGGLYVFREPAGGWVNATETTKLTASDGGLGYAVAIDGDTIVGGSPLRSVSGQREVGVAYVFGPATLIAVTKHLVPASDPGRFDLKVGGVVVKAGAGEGDSGSREVLPGTYRVAEGAAAGSNLSDYQTSIACTLKWNLGPSGNGAQLNVTVADGDEPACTITNRRKAQITVTKHLVPAGDPGRFELKVGNTVVRASAGEGDFGSTRVVAGTFTVSEAAATGTSLANYASSIVCTRNGAPGPSGNGASLKVTVGWGDVLACTITNQPGAKITVTKDLVPASDAGRFDLKVGGTVVKTGAGDGGSGSLGVPAGTYRVAEAAAGGTSLSDYANSIACTRNGNPGPSAVGTPRLDVTVAVGDRLACTITNKRKAQVTLVKHLIPSSDAGRFDLKLTSSTGLVRVARSGAGDGDSGTTQVAPGAWTVLESAASGTSHGDYTSSIACTRNGGPGPSGTGTSLQLTLSPADLLACTITNQRK